MDKAFPIWAVVVLLAGCNAQSFPYARSASVAEGKVGELSSDTALIEAHPQVLSRSGSVLKVGAQTFRDEGDCEAGDCTRYRADGVWHDQYVGIKVDYYEEDDYFLVDRDVHIPIGSRPITSPSGKRFFTGHHDDRGWSPYQGASVWDWYPYPRRLRIVDTNLVAFESFVAWRGEQCVEFTGARGYNVGLSTTRTFWLVEQRGDWQLLEERPAACPVS